MLSGPKNPCVTHIIPIFSYYGAPSDPSNERIINGKVMSYRDLPPGDTKTNEQKEFGLPLNYFEDGKQYNALSGLKDCAKPKLFFYGVNDHINKPENIKRAYEESAEPKEIYALNSEHDYRYHPTSIIEVNQIIENFLEKYP